MSAVGEPPPRRGLRPILSASVPWAVLTVITGCFLLTRSFALLPHAADENLYFYAAWRMSQGLLPYRDFFHAHPPLHLLPTAGLFALFGFSIPLAKTPTFLLAALQGPAVFLVVRRLLPDIRSTARDGGALLAVLLLLSCESMLRAGANDTGICQASGMVALATVLLVYDRPIATGLAAGCAPLILLQSAPACAVVVGAAFLLDRRRGATGRRTGLQTGLAAAGMFVLVHAIAYACAGRAFVEQVYLFHLDKVAASGEGTRQLGYVLFDNWALFTCAGTGALALVLAGPRERVWAALAAGASLLTFVAMATRPRVFPFYFLPAFFPAALAIGLGWATVLNRTAEWLHALVGRRAGPAPFRALLPAAASLCLLTFLHRPLMAVLAPQRVRLLALYTQTYDWVDGPGLGFLNGAIRHLFWQDGRRRAGADPNGLTQYLWQRSRVLENLPELVAEVKRQSAEAPGTTLFGDSAVAPLVALQAGVRITGEVVDTNIQRINAGHLPIDQVLGLLAANPSALVLVGDRGIGAVHQVQRYLAANLRPIRQFPSRYAPPLTLYARR